MRVSSRVPDQFKNVALSAYLSKRFAYLSPDEWLSRIAEGRLRCNDKMCTTDTVVTRGDVVSYDLPEWTEPAADLNYSIVYEDEWILGISKPGNLLVHRAGKSFKNNLMYQLRFENKPAFPAAGAINRLDRETSGIVLVAKDKDTLRIMNKLLAERALDKTYLAITNGCPEPLFGTIDTAIGPDERSDNRSKHRVGGARAKESITEYRTLSSLGEGTFALVEAHPRTGRTHQIRVHLASLGAPIVGDKLYGTEGGLQTENSSVDGNESNSVRIQRHALHCRKVSFIHPITKTACTIESEMPNDMMDLLKYLGNLSENAQ